MIAIFLISRGKYVVNILKKNIPGIEIVTEEAPDADDDEYSEIGQSGWFHDMEQQMNIIGITDLTIPELKLYTELNEPQLLHYYEPEGGIFITESAAVIERAGCGTRAAVVSSGGKDDPGTRKAS